LGTQKQGNPLGSITREAKGRKTGELATKAILAKNPCVTSIPLEGEKKLSAQQKRGKRDRTGIRTGGNKG